MSDEILCSCSKCHGWFNFSELINLKSHVAGVDYDTKVTPCCKSPGWSAKKDEAWFKRYDSDSYQQRYYE